LGVFLREQHQYEEAEPLLREVVKNRELSSNPDDTVLAGSLNALGLLLVKTNRNDEAVTLYTRALDIRDKALGTDHPSTVLIRERLAEITYIQDINKPSAEI
jgi:tetratricopeptide (TPR) repeat protein